MAQTIGLDLGTTSIAGVLYDEDRQEVRHVARRRNDSALPASVPGRAEQDPARLRALALETLAELAAGADCVASIAVTGQMHGLLCIDHQAEPLSPLITWQDQRTAEPGADGRSALDELHDRLAGLSWQANGCRVAHGFGAATLFWLTRHSALPPGTTRACSLPDWIAAQLAGQLPATDPTLACSWGLYRLVDGDWNWPYVERLGLDPRLLPSVQTSRRPLGGLSPAVARQVGLPAGIPVLNTLGDHPASFLGSVGGRRAGRAAQAVQVNLGTGGQIAWWVPVFEPPDEQVETHPFPGDGFLRLGASLCGGAAYAWLNHTVRAWLAEFGAEVDEEAVYRRLNALAQASGTDGLRVRPTFLGVRGEPAIQSGTIEGITPHNLRLGALAQATLEGLIDELRVLYQQRSIGAGRRLLVASGNGVQKNPLMPGLLAERFGLPVEMARWEEPAAVGAAMLAREL